MKATTFRLLPWLLLICALAACHRHHHGLPQVIPCPDKDSASPAGEGHHQHDPCDEDTED